MTLVTSGKIKDEGKGSGEGEDIQKNEKKTERRKLKIYGKNEGENKRRVYKMKRPKNQVNV